MARRKVAALVAAAGIGIALGMSAGGSAAEDEQQGARAPAEQSQPAQQSREQGMGGTSGAAATGVVPGDRMERSTQNAGPFDSTYLTPYEIRTPGPRDNTDD